MQRANLLAVSLMWAIYGGSLCQLGEKQRNSSMRVVSGIGLSHWAIISVYCSELKALI